MKFSLQLLLAYLLPLLLLPGCMLVVDQSKKKDPEVNSDIKFELKPFRESSFKQVEATFYTQKSKAVVFRVLSDIEKTPEWLSRVNSLEVITVYNNHQYLLRTIINSPWPFKNRELISCVDTFFEEETTRINIYSCSERVPINELYMRISQLESSWLISKKPNSFVEVNYKTWIDPAGNVPAFIFNSELIDNTKIDLSKLLSIINSAVLTDYSY